MSKYADCWGNVHSADVEFQYRTLGMIVYEGPTRGRLKVQIERKGDLVLAKLVDVNGFVKKRAQFHLQASRWAG